MAYEVEAFGKIIEVPDDVPKEKAYEQIMANKHKLGYDEFTDPANFVSPEPEALDYAKGFASGANKLVSGVGYLAEVAGAKDTGKAIREFGDRGAAYWNEQMSPGGKKAAESQVFVDDPESITGLRLGDDAGKALLMGAAQSLPSMFAAALPGVAITKGIQALASLGLAGGAGATIPLLAGTAAPVGIGSQIIARVPSAVGFGAAEGVVSGGMNAAGLKSSIEGMSDKELLKSPVYQALRAQHGEEKARTMLADQAASDLFGKTAVSTGTIGALTGGGALGSAYQKVTAGAADGILMTGLKGARQEAIQETPQSGGEKYIENITRKEYLDPSVDPMSGVIAEAASGGAIGAFTGGIVGAGSAINITKQKITPIADAPTLDDAIVAAHEAIRTEDPTLADVEALNPTKKETADETQATIDAGQAQAAKILDIVLPDNSSVKAQWKIVDADQLAASMKEDVNQPRDRTRAASDVQIKSIANAPDYRRLSDSPVMDVGAPVVDQDGRIVAGNGRFAGLSQAYEQGTATEYMNQLREDAARKGLSIEGVAKPVLVRQLSEPVDTRKMAIASNSGTTLQMSALEQANLDAERMKGIENLDVNDLGDIALTPRNLTQLKDSLGSYAGTELGAMVDKGGQLSQEGMRRVRNAMLAKAYGNSPSLEKLVESTDTDMRNVLGALTKSANHIIKTKGDVKPLMEAVDTYSQLKATGQPVDNFLAQQDAFSEGLSKEAESILRFIDTNVRSQKKLTDFFKGNFVEVDTTSADMFETPQPALRSVEPKPDGDTNVKQLEKHLKDNGYDFTVEPPSVRDVDALDSTKKARKELAEKQAKLFKKKVVFVKADGPFRINGVMVPSIADTIFVDIRTDKAFDAIMAHELSHWMEQEKPAVYKELLKSLKTVIINEAEYAKKYGIEGATKAEITKEIVGDLMGDNFTEQSFWQKVAEANPKAFKDIAATIIKWLKGVIVKAKANGMGSEQWVKDATKAQDIIAKAVAQYTDSDAVPVSAESNPKFNITGDNKPAIDKARVILNRLSDLHTKMNDTYDMDVFVEFGERAVEAKDVLASMLESGRLNGIGADGKWLISRNTTSDKPWRVTDFGAKDGEPFSHTEYKTAKQALSDNNLIIDKDKIALFSRAYHGSPHDHNKFDSSKIGTGMGGQAYGYGHYFTDTKDVAEYYKDSTTATASGTAKQVTLLKVDGKDISNDSPDYHAAHIAQMMQEYNVDPKTKDGKDWLNYEVSARAMGSYLGSPAKLKKQALFYLNKDIEKTRVRGRGYEVELAPEQDEYLLWDKVLAHQSDKVKGNIKDYQLLNPDSFVAKLEDNTTGSFIYHAFVRDARKALGTENKGITNDGGEKKASEMLHFIGVRGVKYLDGTSRGIGSGAYNYVIFDDKDVSITAKFSKAAVENTLIAQHNLSVRKLIHADRMGALAVPSIAVTDKTHPLTGFGEITLLADEDFMSDARTFGADIYSTRYPEVSYDFSIKDIQKLNDRFKDEKSRLGESDFYSSNMDDPQRIMKESPAVAMKFLESEGIKPRIKFVTPEEKPATNVLKWVKSSLDRQELTRDPKFIDDVKKDYIAQFKDVPADEMEGLLPENDDQWRNLAVRQAFKVTNYRESLVNKGKVDLDDTRRALTEQIRLNKRSDKFNAYIDNIITEVNPKQEIFDKLTNTGTGRKYIEHNLDNVIRKMRSSFVGGENFGFGLGKIRGVHAPEFKSIEQIRKNKSRLMNSKDFEAVKADVGKEMDDLFERMNRYGTYSGFDNAGQAIFDSAKMGIPKALTYNGFKNVPDDVKSDIATFIEKLRNMPTEYFEAKVLRGVKLGEFKAAIVPKDIPQEALDILKKNGIEDIRKYKSGDNEDRVKQINKVTHVMFSRVMVDGVERPTTNSEGKPINNPVNFWKWFGNSDLVDDRGRPLVVYHGTMADISEFKANKLGLTFVTGDKEFANSYANRYKNYDQATQDKLFSEGMKPNVMPLYASANIFDYRNPDHIKDLLSGMNIDDRGYIVVKFDGVPTEMHTRYFEKGDWVSYENDTVLDRIKALGFNGVKVRELGVDNYAIFSSNQIKSAIGNNGQFSNTNNDIRFSRAPKLYSKLEQALEAANDKVFSTGPQVKLWLQSNAGKLGIKKDEIYWSGIDNWLDAQGKVSKQQVVEFVRSNGVKVEDKTLRTAPENFRSRLRERTFYEQDKDGKWYVYGDKANDTDVYDTEVEAAAKVAEYNKGTSDGITKHNNDKLTLPGGTDYKELVVTVPTIEPHNADDGTHFGDTGQGKQIGWLRMDTRDGGLFIEELQSQRAQQGRSKGFQREVNQWFIAYKDGPTLGDSFNSEQEARAELVDTFGKRDDMEIRPGERDRSTKMIGVPPAPFVSDANNKATNAYVTLLMKKALIEAVSNDHASVSWTTGDQQADRYDLSKQISEVSALIPNAGRRNINLTPVHGSKIEFHVSLDGIVLYGEFKGKHLSEIIGKDLSEKILATNDRTDRATVLTGVDLKVGGEWAQSMYGNEHGLNLQGKPSIISQAANDIFKHVGSGKVESINGQPGFYVTPEMKSKDLPLFSFAGPKAETADKYALETAQQRIAAGDPDDTVRQETGWFKGVDGKWRFEINDSDAKLINPPIAESWPTYLTRAERNKYGKYASVSTMSSKEFKEYKQFLSDTESKYNVMNAQHRRLSSLLDHPKLYAAYPQLRDYDVMFSQDMGKTASFDADHKAIRIGDPSNIEAWKGVLLHEIQHGIQSIEGFARGGSPDNAQGIDIKEPLAEVRKQKAALDIDPYAIQNKKAAGWKIDDDDLKKYAEWEKLREVEDKLLGGMLSPYEAYKRLAGEVEARNTQGRLGMNETERKATAPNATQDIPDSDQIIVYNGVEMAYEPEKPTPPDETRLRRFQRMNQDSFNRFTVIKEWLAENGQTLSDKADVHGAEERYHSMAANQLEDFREQQRNPLIEKIQKAGYTLGDIEVFLKMQHAQEANAANQKLTGNPESTAAGISDEDANEYLAEAPENLAKLANELRDITEQTKKLRLDAGILNTDITGAWENTYKFYVPMKGEADSTRGVGKGLKTNFKSKRRLGHSLRDEHVIENILMDHERAILEVERNRVGKHLVMMAAEMQRPDILSIDQPEKRKMLKESTAYTVEANGVVQGVFKSREEAKMFKQFYAASMPKVAPSAIVINQTKDQRVIASASPMLAENEVNVYMNGHAIRVQINDELLARAYTKMGVEQFSDIVGAGRILNGYLSKVYTGYNPEFILTNMIRDFSSGTINLTGEQGFGMATKALTNYPRMFTDLLKYAATNGKSSTKWIDAYRKNGGNTGAAYLSDMERLGNEVNTEYASYQGVLSNLKQGDTANAARAAGRKVFNATLKWIYNLNQAGENAMRLAAFKAMIDSGRTVNEAAKVAKNITVNFNRKGERQWAPALYLFYNASVQGTAATAHALTKGKHKGQAWALAGSMAAVGYMMAASFGGGGTEDDWDEINDYTKERNMLIKYGDGYVKVPVPYGYGFFWNFGRHMSEAQRTGELGVMPWHLATSAISEFTPFNEIVVGSDEEFRSDQVFMGLLPTAMKIVAQPTFNKQLFTGSELMPESERDKSQPDRQKMFRSTKGTMYDTVAGWLDSAGIDVSPETLKYITRTGTGGAGSLVDTGISAAMLKAEGAELDTQEIPFVRKAYMELGIKDKRAAYYKVREEARTAAEEFNRARRDNDVAKMQTVLKDKKELIALDRYANKLAATIDAARDQQDAVRADKNLSVQEKRLKLKDMEATEAKFYDQYLDVFKTSKPHR